jgi:hypothetical protein
VWHGQRKNWHTTGSTNPKKMMNLREHAAMRRVFHCGYSCKQ